LEQVAGPVQIICRDHRLAPYDALYIELAQRSGCPLAMLDQPPLCPMIFPSDSFDWE
jgi:hypothetical protein